MHGLKKKVRMIKAKARAMRRGLAMTEEARPGTVRKLVGFMSLYGKIAQSPNSEHT